MLLLTRTELWAGELHDPTSYRSGDVLTWTIFGGVWLCRPERQNALHSPQLYFRGVPGYDPFETISTVTASTSWRRGTSDDLLKELERRYKMHLGCSGTLQWREVTTRRHRLFGRRIMVAEPRPDYS